MESDRPSNLPRKRLQYSREKRHALTFCLAELIKYCLELSFLKSNGVSLDSSLHDRKDRTQVRKPPSFIRDPGKLPRSTVKTSAVTGNERQMTAPPGESIIFWKLQTFGRNTCPFPVGLSFDACSQDAGVALCPGKSDGGRTFNKGRLHCLQAIKLCQEFVPRSWSRLKVWIGICCGHS